MNITWIILSIILILEAIGFIVIGYLVGKHFKNIFYKDCEELTNKIMGEIWENIKTEKEQEQNKSNED